MADTAVVDPPIEAQGEKQEKADSPLQTNGDAKGEKAQPTTENMKDDKEQIAKADKGEDKAEKTPEKKSHSRNDDRDSRRDNRHGDRRIPHKGKYGKDSRYGNKFDPSSAKETDDPVEIRKQVEFYFSDSNLPNDKFLFEAIGGSENKPVPIATIHSFKRMRRFQPLSAVVAALKESSTLDVVENDSAIKRKVPLPEGTGSTQPEIQKVFEDKAMSRSVYVKGFGKEEPSTQFDIEAWFSKYGATNQVRLRRTTDSSFKGSAFVEFDSEETAKSFLTLDPPPKYLGRDLIIKSKKQYCDEKVDDLNSGAIRAEEPDERDWKARREQDRKRGFPALHKDGRDGRNRRGSNRGKSHGGRDRRDRRDRDDRTRDRDDKSDNDDDAKAAPANTDNGDESQVDESSSSKKREREEETKEDIPAAKKTAVESEKTGAPEAVEKEASQ